MKKIIKKIIKIFEYIPILWNDEDYDFEYLLMLLKYKLQRISKEIYKNDIIVKNEQRDIFIGINQTINHIDNYLRDMDAFEEIYGKLPFDIVFKTKKIDNGSYQLITMNKNKYRPLTDEEEKIYHDYIEESYNFQQNEWNLIFETLKKEGQKWWD